MANKCFTKLSARSQSSVISQLHKLINYYSSIFCTRERVYLKSLANQDGNIYWLEDDAKKISAFVLLDPNYHFQTPEIEFLTIGHTISSKVGEMDKLLYHIFADHEDQSMFLLCKEFVGQSMRIEEYGMMNFDPIEIQEVLPEIALGQTDYFNVKQETLFGGMVRKNHHGFIKISDSDLVKIQTTKPKLYQMYTQKLQEFEAQKKSDEAEQAEAEGL
jgi:hypothetical protein